MQRTNPPATPTNSCPDYSRRPRSHGRRVTQRQTIFIYSSWCNQEDQRPIERGFHQRRNWKSDVMRPPTLAPEFPWKLHNRKYLGKGKFLKRPSFCCDSAGASWPTINSEYSAHARLPIEALRQTIVPEVGDILPARRCGSGSAAESCWPPPKSWESRRNRRHPSSCDPTSNRMKSRKRTRTRQD